MSRLTIDISEQQHKSLKALAALQGKTIRQYALERLFPADADSDQAWSELKAFIGRRIDTAEVVGGLSGLSVDAIVEDELGREAGA
ncbi:MAG: antitoxin [Novosphingobium sp.]|uniref:antitoxin n=1 Tax=Novosphingobium sp. TaxID=1874826 RepID=UPI003B9AC8F5